MNIARQWRSGGPWLRRILVAALTAVLGMIMMGAAPAQAASTRATVYCNGASCAGKDPSAQGCATDGYTVQLVDASPLGTWAGLELRYSPACNANWARLSAQSYNGAWVSLCVVNDANRADIQCTGSVRNGYLWSPMIDGHKKVFASIGWSLDSGGGGNTRTGAF
ncbi:DUF2690 domain-containing protein [Dactylosporangium sp. NPDC051541]|uniref:DUF2690 domain-containing protein n=1 Tax=Dactylosporangium sp. NPDC051541 TaxID=3363977 RepID=UPI0037A3458A